MHENFQKNALPTFLQFGRVMEAHQPLVCGFLWNVIFGDIQKLRWQNFDQFWPPTYLMLTFVDISQTTNLMSTLTFKTLSLLFFSADHSDEFFRIQTQFWTISKTNQNCDQSLYKNRYKVTLNQLTRRLKDFRWMFSKCQRWYWLSYGPTYCWQLLTFDKVPTTFLRLST